MGGRSGAKRNPVYTIETETYTTIEKRKYSKVIHTHIKTKKKKKKNL